MVSVRGWQRKMAEKFLHGGAPKAVGNLPSATKHVTDNQQVRLSLKKADILRGHGSFAGVFSRRNSVKRGCTKLFWTVTSQIPPSTCRVGFAVRKPGNSVKRNRRRRLMKEAYRHEFRPLAQYCAGRSLSLDLVFYYDAINEPQPPEFVSLRRDLHGMLQEVQAALEQARY
jgi:ribonuclease P protein component